MTSRDAHGTEPLRIGLVGWDSVARAAHIPALLELPGDYRAVAVADPTPTLREQARPLLGLSAEHAYASRAELIEPRTSTSC
jgi:predicted dehydrogenase